MTKRTKYLIGTGLLAVAIIIVVLRVIQSSANVEVRRQNVPRVRLEPPTRETVLYSLQFTGDVVAIQQAGIYSKVSGNLDRVFVDMGTPVRTGQLLALIDTTELYQTYQQAAAAYQNTKLTYVRTRDLFEQTLVSQQDLDNADAALKISSAAYDAARTRLGYARITAPFSGYITKRFLDPGATVTANNATLFSLMDLDVMKIIINVLEKDIPSIAKGRSAVVTVDAFPDREFTGTVTRYSQAVDLSTRTMDVEIDIPNPGHLLRPGMFANVTLILGQHLNAITVPTQALLKNERGFYLFTVQQDSARSVPVTIGIEQNARTEILSGLAGNEPIITSGQQFVKDSGPVIVEQ